MDMKIKRGQILRQLRLVRQLTQNEAAENFGISQQTYQKYESGKTEPPYDLLCDFATFYGVSTDYLLGRTPIKQMVTDQFDPFANIDVSALEKRIIKKYTELNENTRALCIELFLQINPALNELFQEITQQTSEQPIVQSKPQIPPQPVATAPPLKPDIQVTQMMNSEFAVARGGKGLKPAPTDEQFESFVECTADMLGEE